MAFFDYMPLMMATFVLAITPGPVVMTLISTCLSRGVGHGVALISGVLVADAILIGLALQGLSLLAQTLGPWFLAVKVGSGLYLIYLGYRMWRNSAAPVAGPVQGQRRLARLVIFGFLLNMSNPKALVFYAAFLPAFVDIPAIGWPDGLLVTVVICSVITVVNAFWMAAAGGLGGLLRQPHIKKWLDRASGSLLIGAGSVVISR